MNTILDNLFADCVKGEIFIKYQEEPFIELLYPFSGQTKLLITDNTITGENFIEKNEIILEKEKILSYHSFNSSQQESLALHKSIINKKIEFFDSLTSKLTTPYTHDRKFIIYNELITSIFMIPFNIKNINDLDSKENLEQNKEFFKQAVIVAANKAKEVVEEEAKEYIDNNNLDTLEEIAAIKEIIDESVQNLYLDEAQTPRELILNCWPVILTPNPFVLNA